MTPSLYTDAAVYVIVGDARMARYDGNTIDLNDSITSLSAGDVVMDYVYGALNPAKVEKDTDQIDILVLRPLTMTSDELIDHVLDGEYYYDDIGLLTEFVFGRDE